MGGLLYDLPVLKRGLQKAGKGIFIKQCSDRAKDNDFNSEKDRISAISCILSWIPFYYHYVLSKFTHTKRKNNIFKSKCARAWKKVTRYFES